VAEDRPTMIGAKYSLPVIFWSILSSSAHGPCDFVFVSITRICVCIKWSVFVCKFIIGLIIRLLLAVVFAKIFMPHRTNTAFRHVCTTKYTRRDNVADYAHFCVTAKDAGGGAA